MVAEKSAVQPEAEVAEVQVFNRLAIELILAAGDEPLAELVQDLHWIANDALVHPLEVGGLLAP